MRGMPWLWIIRVKRIICHFRTNLKLFRFIFKVRKEGHLPCLMPPLCKIWWYGRNTTQTTLLIEQFCYLSGSMSPNLHRHLSVPVKISYGSSVLQTVQCSLIILDSTISKSNVQPNLPVPHFSDVMNVSPTIWGKINGN